MKSFCSEKRLCCRVAVGCRDAVIGKINFFDESYTEGSILCVRGGEECDFSQLTVCKKDTMRIRENITIPNNMPNIEELIFSSVKVCDIELLPAPVPISSPTASGCGSS